MPKLLRSGPQIPEIAPNGKMTTVDATPELIDRCWRTIAGDFEAVHVAQVTGWLLRDCPKDVLRSALRSLCSHSRCKEYGPKASKHILGLAAESMALRNAAVRAKPKVKHSSANRTETQMETAGKRRPVSRLEIAMRDLHSTMLP